MEKWITSNDKLVTKHIMVSVVRCQYMNSHPKVNITIIQIDELLLQKDISNYLCIKTYKSLLMIGKFLMEMFQGAVE